VCNWIDRRAVGVRALLDRVLEGMLEGKEERMSDVVVHAATKRQSCSREVVCIKLQ